MSEALKPWDGVERRFVDRRKHDDPYLCPKCGGSRRAPAVSAAEGEGLKLDDARCAVCGWWLSDTDEKGCLRGNCSMRPFPPRMYDHARAEREYGRKLPPDAPLSDAESTIASLQRQLAEARFVNEQIGVERASLEAKVASLTAERDRMREALEYGEVIDEAIEWIDSDENFSVGKRALLTALRAAKDARDAALVPGKQDHHEQT